MNIFSKREKKPKTELPPLLEPENPVNYDSVLDYLVGLGTRDYDKLLKVSNIYRNANKDAAKVLGVKDQPTTQLKDEKPAETVDEQLDTALNLDDDDLAAAFLTDDEETPPAVPKKEQAPSKEKKITVNTDNE